jgi:hypothetical protein
MKKLLLFLLSIISVVFLFTGCQTSQKQKIVFLKNPQVLKNYELIPVGKVWKDPSADLRKYDKVMIDSIITSKKLKKSTLEKLNLGGLLGTDNKEFIEFVKYTKNAFERAVKKDKRLSLVDSPGPNTLIVRLALVKVVPGKPLFGIIRNIPIPVGQASFIITPAAKLTGFAFNDVKGSVAIEGELIDSQTGKIVAMFADTRTETPSVINIRAMSTYGTPRKIVDGWAVLFVRALNRKPGSKLDAPPLFKLIEL